MNTFRTTCMISVMLILTFFGLGTAFGGTIEGRVQGLNCVVNGKVCPVDDQDPHIALEDHFVVVTGKDSYYFIPNMKNTVLSRHLMEKVRVTGETSETYKTIQADKFEVLVNGDWKTTWSKELEERQRKLELYSG